MSGKRQFLCFVPLRRAKNSKNCVSSTDDERKMAKTAFLPREKVRITHFLRFRLPRKATSPAHSMKAECLSSQHDAPRVSNYLVDLKKGV